MGPFKSSKEEMLHTVYVNYLSRGLGFSPNKKLRAPWINFLHKTHLRPLLLFLFLNKVHFDGLVCANSNNVILCGLIIFQGEKGFQIKFNGF